MPEVTLAIVAILLVFAVPIIGGILGFVAVRKLGAMAEKLDLMRSQLDSMYRDIRKVEQIARGPAAKAEPEKEPPQEPAVPPRQVAAAPPPPPPPAPAVSKPAEEKRPEAEVSEEKARESVHTRQEVSRLAPQPPFAPAKAPGGDNSWAQFEKTVGTKWVAYAGGVLLFFAAAFFVKFAFDSGWLRLGPQARIAGGMIFSLALVVAGDMAIRRKMAPLGHSLMGAGLASLYAVIFAGYKIYDLYPQTAAFASMAAVTAGGMALAVLHDAVVMAIIAILGGFLTPVLLSTGVDARDALFTYVMLLDAGVLGVSIFKKWRALEILAFAGTTILYGAWHSSFYAEETLLPALLWLGGFYVVFLFVPFAYHLRTKDGITVERFLLAVANAVWAFVLSYQMLYQKHEVALGFVALALAAVYLVMGIVVRKRMPGEITAPVFGFVAMAITFLTMAVPLELGLNGILLAWAVEGPVLLYLGYRFDYKPVRVLAFCVLAIAFFRLVTENWPNHSALFVLFWNVKWGVAMSVPAAMAAFAVIHHRWRKMDWEVDRKLKITAAVVGGLLATALVAAEVTRWVTLRPLMSDSYSDYLAQCAVIFVLAVSAAIHMAAGVKTKCKAALGAGFAVLTVGILVLMPLYGDKKLLNYTIYANLRFVMGLLCVAGVFAYGKLAAKAVFEGDEAARIRVTGYSLGAVILLILLSTETYTYLLWAFAEAQKARWAASMSLSVVWSLYATAALALGFRWRTRYLRFAALALFGITAFKVVIVDMADLKQIFRIVSFFALGALLIAAAFLYNRVEKRVADFFGEKP